jgi:hypothetical protein
LLDAQRQRFEAPIEVPEEERLVIDSAGPPNEVVQAALLAVYRRRLERDAQAGTAISATPS